MYDSVKTEIRRFVLNGYLQGESPENLKDDTPLRTSGVLDSMGTLALVSFLEKTYGIEIDAHETGIENFDRLQDIAAFVARKKGLQS
jgi:acyl carrier protein